ncbi:MAG: hypothetical protein HYZ53_16865 [Planctomycetes bacterium]|nr:hypothetical protein [Planctomycetota bacterium]
MRVPLRIPRGASGRSMLAMLAMLFAATMGALAQGHDGPATNPRLPTASHYSVSIEAHDLAAGSELRAKIEGLAAKAGLLSLDRTGRMPALRSWVAREQGGGVAFVAEDSGFRRWTCREGDLEVTLHPGKTFGSGVFVARSGDGELACGRYVAHGDW